MTGRENADDGTLHVDTGNPWFFPMGSSLHLLVDIIRGNTGGTMGSQGNRMLSILALLLAFSASAVSQVAGHSHAPGWRQELVPDLSHTRNGSNPLLIDKTRAGINFVDNSHLIVYVVKRDYGELSYRDNLDLASSFRLQMWLVDAGSGQVEFTRSAGTRFHDSIVQVTTSGVLVQTGNLLRLYSFDLKTNRDVYLTPLQDPLRTLTTVSASGKTILVERVTQQGKVDSFDVLDADTLNRRFFWNQSLRLYSPYSISDTGIAFKNVSGIFFAEFGKRPLQLTFKSNTNGILTKNSFCDSLDAPVFVTNDQILHGCGQLSLISLDGSLLYEDDLGRGTSLDHEVAVARDSHIVAVSLIQREGRDIWDTGKGIRVTSMAIEVYDLLRKKRLLNIEMSPVPKNDYAFALSPDGTKLAVLTDRDVELYHVSAE